MKIEMINELANNMKDLNQIKDILNIFFCLDNIEQEIFFNKIKENGFSKIDIKYFIENFGDLKKSIIRLSKEEMLKFLSLNMKDKEFYDKIATDNNLDFGVLKDFLSTKYKVLTKYRNEKEQESLLLFLQMFDYYIDELVFNENILSKRNFNEQIELININKASNDDRVIKLCLNSNLLNISYQEQFKLIDFYINSEDKDKIYEIYKKIILNTDHFIDTENILEILKIYVKYNYNSTIERIIKNEDGIVIKRCTEKLKLIKCYVKSYLENYKITSYIENYDFSNLDNMDGFIESLNMMNVTCQFKEKLDKFENTLELREYLENLKKHLGNIDINPDTNVPDYKLTIKYDNDFNNN